MLEGLGDAEDPPRSSETPKVSAVAMTRNSDISTATSSAASTPRTSLLPSSALVPSRSVWKHSSSSPQLPVKPPLLPRPWSSQSLPAPFSPDTPGSARNLGGLLPASSLAACPEPPHSLMDSALSSALSHAAGDGYPQGGLMIPAFAAHQLHALTEGEVSDEGASQLKNAVAKIEAAYAEELQSSQAARQAAVHAQKEAEAELAAMRCKLELEQKGRQQEQQLWNEEKSRLQTLLRMAIDELPPTAVPQSLRLASQTMESLSGSSTSLTTSLVSSDSVVHSGVDFPKTKPSAGAPSEPAEGSLPSALSPGSAGAGRARV
mmetsp:Transcript_46047/g.107600  ORF Transcript_46047/g.107600 Transcript_46047/m.107600 type:complete len:319 (-) Transcript_46047:162-1118(-)